MLLYLPAFVLNHAEMTHFRPEYISYMQKSLRQLMKQSKLKFTGQLPAVIQLTLYGRISNNYIANNNVYEAVIIAKVVIIMINNLIFIIIIIIRHAP